MHSIAQRWVEAMWTLILIGATMSSAAKSMRKPLNCVTRVQFCFIYWLYITALLSDCTYKQYKCVLLLTI